MMTVRRRDSRRKYNIKDGPSKQNVILKPCPFCGEQEKIVVHIIGNYAGDWLLVKCEECNAVKNVYSLYLETVEVSWNNRPGKMWDPRSKEYISTQER